MPSADKRIDAYIAKSKEFAQPILTHFRALIHKTCPDVEETVKWGMPFFTYEGDNLCMMAAFKEHCVLGFWKAKLMSNKKLMENASSEAAMGHLGKIMSMKDLPPNKELVADIKEAMKLNEDGIKLPSNKKVSEEKKKALKTPAYLTAALKRNKKAWAVFDAFAYSHKKEYIQWIEEAKTEATREKRIAQAIEWISEGKGRNWKYQKK